MITYPSTHGVYEAEVREVCAAVHEAGGQVYVDGANLNALVGLARPGAFGGDVSHLNLHKTFCIPHGGGGPGVGPVAVAAHLAPFLPGGEGVDGVRVGAVVGGAVRQPGRAADLVDVRADDGLRRPAAGDADGGGGGELRGAAAGGALPGALQRRGRASSPTSASSTCGGITKTTGVTVDDVAKRLADYGLHAPTMSFPVAGTLMVEPTESEDLAEIDRFVDAMIGIRGEIDRVAAGEWPRRRQPAARRPAHRGVPGRQVGPPVPARAGRLPDGGDAGRARPQGVAAGAARRRRARRPQPRLLLPAGGGLRRAGGEPGGAGAGAHLSPAPA